MTRWAGADGRVLAGLPLVLVAGGALAQTETGETAGHEAGEITAEIVHEAEHESGGMPQLDATTFASQILWLIICFVALYWLLKAKALPRVADILEARQERISADLDKAAALRAEAETAHEQYQAVVAEAQAKAQAEIKATRELIAADIASRTHKLDQDLAARIHAAESAVGTARDRALGELEGVAVEVAQAATERLIGVSVDEAEARAALDAVRKEVA